jgi:hypothetical protein
MRAVGIDRFGGPDVLTVMDIDKPEPGAHDVLVRVIAAGTNPVRGPRHRRRPRARAQPARDARLRAVGLDPPAQRRVLAHRRLDSGHGWGKVVLQVA